MNKIPIAFAFDNNMCLPAAVCFYSLLSNANTDTYYDIFILHHKNVVLDLTDIHKILKLYPQSKITLVKVDDTFEKSFQIRGITTATYYRLLIPVLIPQYDKILYSDVDVIFREDLSVIYNTELNDCLFGGVCALAHLDNSLVNYYNALNIDPHKVVYAGNLLINSKLIRETKGKIEEFIKLAQNNYKYQDLDVINISCQDEIYYLPSSFCYTTDISCAIADNNPEILKIWSKDELKHTLKKGLIHYNGQKPWKAYCINFDIWWEYYRKSPIFDKKFYYDFFNKKLNDYDTLSLWKRIKILMRYFIHGRKI